MKRPFMVWIGFKSICCSKVAKEGKSCPRLLVLQRVAQNAKKLLKSCRAQSIYAYWANHFGCNQYGNVLINVSPIAMISVVIHSLKKILKMRYIQTSANLES